MQSTYTCLSAKRSPSSNVVHAQMLSMARFKSENVTMSRCCSHPDVAHVQMFEKANMSKCLSGKRPPQPNVTHIQSLTALKVNMPNVVCAHMLSMILCCPHPNVNKFNCSDEFDKYQQEEFHFEASCG